MLVTLIRDALYYVHGAQFYMQIVYFYFEKLD